VSNGRVPDLAIVLAHAEADVLPAAEVRPEGAFADGVLRHEPALRRLVHRLLGWPKTSTDVDDIVQEVLLAAWRHRRRFRGDSQWSTWLLRIGINATRNHQRRRALWRRLFGRQPAAAVEPATAAPEPDLDARLAPVRAAMAELRHADRELLVLHYLEQRPVERIVEDLGISRNAVDVRLSRARGRLRALLPEGEG
jgi:RNA polymerase sigma-70 factor (ECF subfamily)